jgi:uncharacterized protein YoxC
MPMRLLPKQEISVKQASKQKAEIDEGVKLARRVDSLREIAATEEASLASFRASTLKAIQEDIQKIETERNEVLNQVKTLREEIKEGTKVLDDRENSLKQLENALKQYEIDVNERLNILKITSEELKKQSKLSNNYYLQTVNAMQIIEEVRKETSALYSEASNYLEACHDTYMAVHSLEAQITSELKARDIAVASRERDVIIKQEHLDILSKSLHTKELQLIDREQTLEREFNRLKKKYG